MSGWETESLGKLCHIVRGGSPRPIDNFLTDSADGYNWLKIGDTQGVSKYICFTKQKIKKEGLGKTRLVKPGDLILSNSMSFGKPFIMKIDACIHDGWLSLSIKDHTLLNSDFLYYTLGSPSMFTKFGRSAAGSSVRNLKIDLVQNIKINFPSLAEQKIIANTLQTWDTAIEKTEALIAAKERQFGWFCTSVIRESLPSDSSSMPLSHVYEFKKGAGLSKADIAENGRNKCILYGQLYTTYGEIIEHVCSRTDLQNGVRSVAGDILIPGSTTTSAIDLANVTALLIDNVLLGGDINILRPKSKQVSSEFMAYYLTHCKKHDLARLAQGITIVHLYGRDIKSIRISLPDLHTQKKIVNLLRTARHEIDLLKVLVEQYRAQKRGLMQKLLTGKWGAKKQWVN